MAKKKIKSTKALAGTTLTPTPPVTANAAKKSKPSTKSKSKPPKANKNKSAPKKSDIDWPTATAPSWEAEIKSSISTQHQKVLDYLRTRYGLPADHDGTTGDPKKTEDYAIRLANAAEPHQFIAELKNGIRETGQE